MKIILQTIIYLRNEMSKMQVFANQHQNNCASTTCGA